ncbi:MAG: NADP-dependent isocitrate dehydrogenase, partial [Phycisphaerales bacterium]
PTQVVGCDLYLDTTMPIAELAEQMQKLCEGTPFKLTMISNRGTQVWPTGSVYTECVDYYRVRFESRKPSVALEQTACLFLLNAVAAKHLVAEYELLRLFDGVKGYSLAQGQ